MNFPEKILEQGGVCLTDTLKQLLDESPHIREAVAERIFALMNEYELVQAQTNEISAAHHFNLAVQQFVDEEIGNIENVSCKKGCANCCKINVDITDHEAKLLIEVSKELGISIDIERLKIQSDTDNYSYCKLPDEQKTCVFLKDNICQVYEYRPAACRKHLTISPAEACDATINPYGKIHRVAIMHAEIVASASMNASKSDNMAKMILKNIA